MQGRPRAASGSLPAAAAGPSASLLGRRRTRSEAEQGQGSSQQRLAAVAPPNTAAQSYANSGASSPRALMDPASAPALAFTPGMHQLPANSAAFLRSAGTHTLQQSALSLCKPKSCIRNRTTQRYSWMP